MRKALLLVSLAALTTACSSLYYGAMERVGIEKRDILTDRVEEVKEAQTEGQETFRSALEHYRSVVQIDGGDLEERYDALQEEYDNSTAAAQKIRDRVDAVEEVAERLFSEWEDELEEYDSRSLRQDSARKLQSTQRNYNRLIEIMRNAEERLDPALEAMQDQVLYLKHNLNARAIASLDDEARTVTRDVDALLESMQRAIEEADAFLASMADEGDE